MKRELDDLPGALRIWTSGEGPGPLTPDGLGVEWQSAGDPPAYALLGGHLAQHAQSSVQDIRLDAGGRYAGSLAGTSDEVEFGLPGEYHDGLAQLAGVVDITVAAHGRVGSSLYAFERVSGFLRELLVSGVPVDDKRISELWSRVDPH